MSAGVAADMWNAVIETGEAEAIVDNLANEYDVDEITLRSDLQAFIDDLLVRGILEVRENAERQPD
jgi:DeoR/GlpR family transcriptional regulator of sugar metabolism